jgi:enoyl-CoA hydratase/carnithine racemase
MLYGSEILDADQALASGLVDAVHEPDKVLGAAIEYAERVAKQSWRALELTKVALRIHRPATTLFDMTAQALLFESEDKRLRMKRFLEERQQRRAARSAPEDGGQQ